MYDIKRVSKVVDKENIEFDSIGWYCGRISAGKSEVRMSMNAHWRKGVVQICA
jgi:hypothetical protein